MKIRFGLAALFCCLLAVAQRSPGDLLARFRDMSDRAEKTGLAEPYRGIAASSGIEPGLFPVRASGVPTDKVHKAATAFLAALTPEQRSKTVFPVDDPEWRKWMNQHFHLRQGVSFKDLDEKQREAAFALMRASLSVKGMKLTRDIMRLNETLGELNGNDFVQYGEWLYHITIMGEPSARKPWGWQLDGHHAIVNYFVLGDQVVMTPLFVGSEPVIATGGRHKGTAILQEEQKQGHDMLMALEAGLRDKAVLSVSKTANNNVGEAFKDNVTLDYSGAAAKDMPQAARERLVKLIGLFVSNMDDGHARVKMEEVRKHLDRTHFAWIGKTDGAGVFYYRIHSPVILIEFDHQRPAGLRHLAKDPTAPNREHIHVVVRAPNGNDYGKDLLRQHYTQSKHSGD